MNADLDDKNGTDTSTASALLTATANRTHEWDELLSTGRVAYCGAGRGEIGFTFQRMYATMVSTISKITVPAADLYSPRVR
jgi:hypothetical protein